MPMDGDERPLALAMSAHWVEFGLTGTIASGWPLYVRHALRKLDSFLFRKLASSKTVCH